MIITYKKLSQLSMTLGYPQGTRFLEKVLDILAKMEKDTMFKMTEAKTSMIREEKLSVLFSMQMAYQAAGNHEKALELVHQ